MSNLHIFSSIAIGILFLLNVYLWGKIFGVLGSVVKIFINR